MCAVWHAVERMQQLISVLGVSLAFNSICFSVGLVSYWTKALQSLAWVQCPVPPSTAGPWQWLLLVLYCLLCFTFRRQSLLNPHFRREAVSFNSRRGGGWYGRGRRVQESNFSGAQRRRPLVLIFRVLSGHNSSKILITWPSFSTTH